MAAILDKNQVEHVMKVSMQERVKEGAVYTSNSVQVTVNGLLVQVIDLDIHKIDGSGILMATITLPITLGSE